MMGDEIHDESDGDSVSPVDPSEQHRTHHAICRELMRQREDALHAIAISAMQQKARSFDAGLTPAAACGVGCKVCGVLDASPSRCEYCAHGVGFQRPAWLDTQPAVHHVDAGRPFTGRAPGMLQDDDKGLSKWLSNRPNAKHIAREAAAMIGRGHIAAETPDTEGGAE
jgi:hypothetical protein